MRKLFTFLFAALMSAGMFAATEVTITQNDFPKDGNSFTKDGVTVSAGNIDSNQGNLMNGGSFSTTLGNFTKIEVTASNVGIFGPGWNGTPAKKTWTGNASSLSFSGDIMGMGMGTTLKFTIEEPTVAVTGVTLNQSEAQMTVGGETLTLTATVNPNNATDQSVSWSTSDANVATVENGVVTAVAAGNATITVTTTDGSFTATCAVTVTAPEPAGEVTVVFAANDKTVERTVTLPHTFKCDWNNGMAGPDELDNIIVELYNDYYYCDNNIQASGSDQVEAGTEEDPKNDYITIKGVFEGTATVTGDYESSDAEDLHYTLTISIKNSEPQPDSETLETNKGDASYTGTHFSVTPNAGQEGDSKGFFVTYTDHATISALNGETILSVELTVGDGEDFISYFGASKGNVSHSGSLITISDVNATSVELLMTILGGLQIKQVKIYYEEKSTPTAIDEVGSQEPKAKSQKLIKNGMLLIVRDGKLFNVTGAQVR